MTFVEILSKLYRSQLVSFPSPYTTEVAFQRLSPLVQRTALNIWFQEGVVGKVTPTRVTLYHHKYPRRNSFKPFFTGTFTPRNGGTVLAGYFSMHWFIKVFMTVWFGGLAAGAFLILYMGIVQKDPLLFLMLLGPCAIGALGCALVHIGWKESSDDVAYISEAIRRGIGDENAG
jgi:hypothetical protein